MPDDTLASGPPREPTAQPQAIGRYTIEHVLGAGGMGIVYAAHDPDLDRRIALKVLRVAHGETQGRARLLREARAMAKLSHANVITVHEVGTAGDVDFVAMELIDGANAADWLVTRRTRDEVLRVLIAAGRGLAAAHRGGLVHRDFKPHNVLVGKDGRVVVTDFGLARAFDDLAIAAPVAGGASMALDATMQATPKADAGSLSSTLTQTGAMLGTPAYMAPEQFAGELTGPATDQFAFAVALWEGLAGKRPFRGDTLDELRRNVEAGVLPDAPIPRGIRRVLARGLARDPAARWPSVDAMLIALERAIARPRRLAMIAAAAALAGVALAAYLLTRPSSAAAPSACRPPEGLYAAAMPERTFQALAQRFGGQPGWPAVSADLDRFGKDWIDVYRTACKAPEAPEFHGRIACLETALDELSSVTDGAADAPPEAVNHVELSEVIASPKGCVDGTRRGFPPLPADPAVAEQVRTIRRGITQARTASFAGQSDAAKALIAVQVDAAHALPYRAIYAEALEAQGDILDEAGDPTAAAAAFEQAATEAEASGHLPMRADALIGVLAQLETSDLGRIRAAADAASAAIDGAGGDPAKHAIVDLVLSRIDARTGDLDAAIEKASRARAAFVAAGESRRAGSAAMSEGAYRQSRRQGDDLAQVEILFRAALADFERVSGADSQLSRAARDALGWTLWQEGKLDDAHAVWAKDGPPPPDPARTLHAHGRVVDVAGQPVAGATVAIGTYLAFDPGLQVLPQTGAAIATTGDDGRFALDVVPGSIAAAADAERRSNSVVIDDQDATLVLAESGAVTGTTHLILPDGDAGDPRLHVAPDSAPATVIELRTTANTRDGIRVPIAADGSWRAPHVPVGHHMIEAVIDTRLDGASFATVPIDVRAGEEVHAAPLTIDLRGVVLDLIVRGDRDVAIPMAEVHVFPGKVASGVISVSRLLELMLGEPHSIFAQATKLDDTTRTDAGKPLYQADDIHARLAGVPPGVETVCVVPFAGDIYDRSYVSKLQPRIEGVEVHCEQITVAATPPVQAAIVHTPPMNRLK